MMNIHFESEFAVLSHSKNTQSMNLQIKGFIKENEFKNVLLKAIDYFGSLGVTKILTDFREFKGTTPAIQQWVAQTYYPALVQKGLTHGALVLNGDVFAKYTAKNVLSKINHMFEYPAFSDINEAEKWLKNQ